MTTITGNYLREKAKRKRETNDEEAKKRARAEYEKYLMKCLEYCDNMAGLGLDESVFSTHERMEKDEAIIKELLSREITATYFTKSCNSSLCECNGDILYCYKMTWEPAANTVDKETQK